MLAKIINSQNRLAILSLLFKNPNQKYYAREIARILNLDQANVHKELQNLVVGGFISLEIKENKKYFFVSQKNIFYKGLEELFSHYQAGTKSPELICIEEMPNYYPMMVTLPFNNHRANSYFINHGLTKRFSCLSSIYRDNLCQLIVPKQEFKEIGLEILEKVKHDPAWGQQYVNELHLAEAKLYQASNQLNKLNLQKYSDPELLKIYEDYYQIYSDLHLHHWVQTVLDFDENIFSKYLLNYLKTKCQATKYSLGDVFSTLTTPTIEAQPALEYHDLLLILQEILRSPQLKKYFITTETRIIVQELPLKNKKLAERIKKHASAFGFLGYNTIGPAWGEAYFVDILSSLARQGANPKKLMKEQAKNRLAIKVKQDRLVKELKIDKQHFDIFQFARDLVFSKGTRKDAMFHSYSIIENLFKEIGRRYYLSVRQVRYFHPHEFRKLLLEKKFPPTILNERYKFSVNFSTGDYHEDLNLVGAKAVEFIARLNIVKEEIKDVKILYGDCASPGRVRGEVRIINVPKDMVKMNQGDILVSVATTPDLVPAIKKAAAIITDAGGITCHAAIISRELGIPCVVGTKIATKVLHDGDLVDANATHGKVDIIKGA